MSLLINQKSDWQRNLNLGQVAALLIGGTIFTFTYKDPRIYGQSTLNFISEIILGILLLITTLYTMFLIRSHTYISGAVDIISMIAGIITLIAAGVSSL